MPSEQKNLIIIGVGGHARAVIDAAELQGFNILGIFDTNYHDQEEEIINYKVMGDFSALEHFDTNVTDKIKIGSHVIVGAGSVIIQDVVSNSTVVGVPGKHIR